MKIVQPTTAMEAAHVIGMRLPIIAQAMCKPTAKLNREMIRMVQEKQEAVALGMIGAHAALAGAWLNGAMQFGRVATEMMSAAEAPALKTLSGNVRRLSRRR